MEQRNKCMPTIFVIMLLIMLSIQIASMINLEMTVNYCGTKAQEEFMQMLSVNEANTN